MVRLAVAGRSGSNVVFHNPVSKIGQAVIIISRFFYRTPSGEEIKRPLISWNIAKIGRALSKVLDDIPPWGVRSETDLPFCERHALYFTMVKYKLCERCASVFEIQ